MPDLRAEFREGSDALIERRRGIVGLSIGSVCILGVIGLYQVGILKSLPPHSKLFNPEKVHGSELGYRMIVKAPDAVVGMASYVATGCLAATGGVDRWKTARLLPLAMGAKCAADAALSAKLAVTQWTRFRTLSPWSLLVFAATCGSLVLAGREFLAAARQSD